MPPKKQNKSDDAELDELLSLAQQTYDSTRKKERDAQAKKREKKMQDMEQRQEDKLAMMQQMQIQERLFLQQRAAKKLPEATLTQGVEWFEVAPGKYLRYEQYTKAHMQELVTLFDTELSEPYSVFTYEYFLQEWPDLCVVAYGMEATAAPAPDARGELIGAVVSKVARKAIDKPLRGYVAMLAVRSGFRGMRIGSRLVAVSVDLMKQKEAEEVYLETPTWNTHALKVYENLGFVKSKFLTRYYLDGSDAVRLKLWLQAPLMRQVR